jgi:very-short-patch-repair endonuclease
MHKRTTQKTFSRAKALHRNMTDAEAKLWRHLRAHRMGDVHFRNQHAIGNYIVDFCTPRKKLIIELDGSQHLEQREYDEVRTKYFEAKGYRVLRFWNNDVMNNMDAVLELIWSVLNEKEMRRQRVVDEEQLGIDAGGR